MTARGLNRGLPAAGPGAVAALDEALSLVEQRLQSLHEALLSREPAAIERRADELHRALARAAAHGQAARAAELPPALRHRLAGAGAQVAQQREGLLRAGAALDRALLALLPGDGPTLYGAGGTPEPRTRLSPQGLDA